MYYIKLFDENLISFNMNNELGLKVTEIKVLSKNRELFPIILQKDVNENTIISFIKSRIIPKNRAFVQSILQSAGLNINDTKGIIDISKGLSLIDSYWIVQDTSLKFEDYNLFDNEFSEVLSLIAFTGHSSKIKDLITSPEFTTNGALPKAWRRINGQVYLYKGGTDPIYANTGNEPYSEYYASEFATQMGISHVDYELEKWKGMLASVCELFTNKNTSYIQIGDLVQTGGIDAVYKYLKEQGLQEKFADMIIFDSLIFNTDRHFGNFGVLRDNITGKIIDFAPIFDNGEGLLSKAMLDIFDDVQKFEEYINSDTQNISYYGTPYKSLIKAYCGKKQVESLRKILNFNFTKHSKYNLSDNRLELLSKMVQKRAREFIDILNEKA